MLNPAWTTLADKLVGLFAACPQVEAVALGGSLQGTAADAMSDIDLYVYTRGDIPLNVRRAIVERSGGASVANVGLTFWGPGDEWFDAQTGIEVDIVYFDAEWMAEQLERVIHKYQPAMGYTTCFWYTISHSQARYDPHGWFADLQTLSRWPYPEALRRNIIAFNHPVLRGIIPAYAHQIEKAVKRGDWISVNHRLAALLASYFDVLFALNRVLHPGEKRLLPFALKHCSKLPVDLEADIVAVLQAAAQQTAPQQTAEPQSAAALPARIALWLDHLDDLLRQEGLDELPLL